MGGGRGGVQAPTPVGQIGRYTVVREERMDRIQEFWAINYCVMVRELGARYKKFWPISHHDRSIYLAAYDGEVMVGGMRIIRPLPSAFFTQSLIGRPNTLPDAESLRRLGEVGELTSLVTVPEARGKFDLVECDQLIRKVALDAGISHVVLSAVIPWRAPALYRLLGYQAYADPQVDFSLKRSPDDAVPNVLPMIGATGPDQPMPEDRWGYSLSMLEKMTIEYLATDPLAAQAQEGIPAVMVPPREAAARALAMPGSRR